jgi:hypothetical protein
MPIRPSPRTHHTVIAQQESWTQKKPQHTLQGQTNGCNHTPQLFRNPKLEIRITGSLFVFPTGGVKGVFIIQAPLLWVQRVPVSKKCKTRKCSPPNPGSPLLALPMPILGARPSILTSVVPYPWAHEKRVEDSIVFVFNEDNHTRRFGRSTCCSLGLQRRPTK